VGACLFVALAIAVPFALHPPVTNSFLFVLFFAAIVFTAWFGGYGLSLLALVLSWYSIDSLILDFGDSQNVEMPRSQLAFAYFAVGVAVSVLTRLVRTARQRAPERASEARKALQDPPADWEWLQITLASITDAVITTDPYGQVVFLNPVAERLTGWAMTEAAGRHVGEVVQMTERESRSDTELSITQVVNGGQVIVSGHPMLLTARDGTARTVEHCTAPIRDVHGAIRGVVLIIRDITEHRRARRAQRASEERFRQLVDHLHDVFWIHELDRPSVAYVSPAYEAVWGRSCSSLYESPLSYLEAVHPEDREQAARARRELEGGEATANEYRVIQPDGTVRWVWDRGFPVRDKSGRVVRLVGIAEDITERKRVEHALHEADRRKDEFLAMLSHELRNPLAPIQSSLELMKHSISEGGDWEQEYEVMAKQVAHLTRLVDDLLDVSRISHGKIELRKEEIELSPLLHRVIKMIRPRLDERQLEFEVSLPAEPIRLYADPTRLEQILWNLLSNSAKYTDSGGRVWLSAESWDDHVVLRVRDTGTGISAKVLPRIFEFFVQEQRHDDRSRGGLGIGLSLVKALVELHGGWISARSEGPGRGAEFLVSLPALTKAQQRRIGPKAAGRTRLATRSSRRRILVVDDNVDAANSLAKLLSRIYDQEVRVAHDGPSALEAAEEFRPDAVILDIEMPEMDGHEVARRLRRRPELEGVILVALTGWGQEDDRRRSKEAGFDHHLAKPVEADVLLGLITSAQPMAQTPVVASCSHAD
jgi:two-component system CheB/CheR fusion protein